MKTTLFTMFLKGWDIRNHQFFQSEIIKNHACYPNMLFDTSNHIKYEKVTETWSQRGTQKLPKIIKNLKKSTNIFKKVRFRIRFFNDFGVISRCFRQWFPPLSLTTSCTIVPAQNIGFVLLFTVFKVRQPFERKTFLNKNHMRFACFFVVFCINRKSI